MNTTKKYIPTPDDFKSCIREPTFFFRQAKRLTIRTLHRHEKNEHRKRDKAS